MSRMPHIDAKIAAATKDRAEALFSKGRWKESLEAYERIRPYGSKDPRILLRMGDIARRLDEKGAVPYYKEAVEGFAKLGFLIKAIAVCKVVIGIDPGEEDVQRRLAELANPNKSAEGRKEAGVSKAPTTPAPPTSVTPPPLHRAASPATPPPSPPPSTALEKTEAGVDMEIAFVEPSALPRVPLFSDLTEAEFLEVVRKVKAIALREGEYLFREGDSGDAIYFVAEGAVDVVARSKDGAEVPIAGLKEGDVFGEFGFFSGSRRASGVKAGKGTTVLELTKKDLDEVIALHKRVEDVLFEFYKERVVDRLMALSSVFKPLGAGYRKEVLKHLRPVKFPAGALVMKEREEGETMYLIKEGGVSVWVREPSGEKKEIGRLQEGDFFGEIALATNKPRVANVTAETEVSLVEFSRTVIRDISARYPEVKEILASVIRERIADLLGRKEDRARLL